MVCGKPGTIKWTLSKGAEVWILDVCAEDEGQLLELATHGRTRPSRSRTGSQKRSKFEPLDWTPPS